MKKNYIAPEAALVNYAAETMLALSIPVVDGFTGEVAGSNRFDFEEDWEEEF